MTKILVIGQAPPAVKQKLPYDTTMFYDWLSDIGISKERAQNLFDFDAVYDKFPGYSESGHKTPSDSQMNEYWERSLRDKVLKSSKIWVVGNVAMKFLTDKENFISEKKLLFTMHPSKRNMDAFRKVKPVMLERIKRFIYD